MFKPYIVQETETGKKYLIIGIFIVINSAYVHKVDLETNKMALVSLDDMNSVATFVGFVND